MLSAGLVARRAADVAVDRQRIERTFAFSTWSDQRRVECRVGQIGANRKAEGHSARRRISVRIPGREVNGSGAVEFDEELVLGRRTLWKFGKMGNFNMKRPRWRGPALGGLLRRGARYCFAAFDGEATTAQLTEWCRPEIVLAGGKPTAFQMANQCTALRSIGARRVRRHGKGWVWRLPNDAKV
jgi:hypothetical protein